MPLGAAVPAALGEGSACPGCGHGGYAELEGRASIQCNRCKRQVGLTAGDRVPLDQTAADHVVFGDLPPDPEQGREVARSNWRGGGASRKPTAWLQAQADGGDGGARGGEARLAGREIDDAYLGGQRTGGKRGRGTRQDAVRGGGGDDRRAQAQAAQAHGGQGLFKEIAPLAKCHLAAGSNVVSDGLSCWAAVAQAGCSHFPMFTGSGSQAARWVPFHWVNMALGNIKTALAGTYHHVAPSTPSATFPVSPGASTPLPARHPDRAPRLCCAGTTPHPLSGSSSLDE